MAKIKKGLAGAEDVEVYGDTIPISEPVPEAGIGAIATGGAEITPYEEYDEYGYGAHVGLGAGAAAVGGATLTPPVTPVSEPKPEAEPSVAEVVEEVPVEEVPVEAPWALPEHKPVPEPRFEPTAIPEIKVEPAPAYEKSPQQLAWEEMYGGELTDLIKEGGRGIPEATQQLMKKQIYEGLKGREQESLRKLRQDMEERGITNSGLLFSEESKIRSATTKAMASSITEIGIKSAFMKMASFERALGMAGNFLGYLSQESQLAYAPRMATWQAKQQAKLVRFQANMDVYKMKLQQAYTVNNMYTAQKLESELNEQVFQQNIVLAEMEIEAAQEMAKAEAAGSISGTIVGGIISVATGGLL